MERRRFGLAVTVVSPTMDLADGTQSTTMARSRTHAQPILQVEPIAILIHIVPGDFFRAGKNRFVGIIAVPIVFTESITVVICGWIALVQAGIAGVLVGRRIG